MKKLRCLVCQEPLKGQKEAQELQMKAAASNSLCTDLRIALREIFPFSSTTNSIKTVPLTSIKTIVEENLFENVHFVKYEQLVKTPQEELNKLYKFLELKSFKHDFENINTLDRVDTPFLPYGQHSISKSIKNHKTKKRQLNNEVEDFIDKEFKWYYERFYNE